MLSREAIAVDSLDYGEDKEDTVSPRPVLSLVPPSSPWVAQFEQPERPENLVQPEISSAVGAELNTFLLKATTHGLYRHRLKAIRPLELGEQKELLEEVQHGNEAARRRLVETNQGLVLAIARSYHSEELDFMDLVQEGTLGLITAVDKFKPKKNFQFSTYAWEVIRNQIWLACLEAKGLNRYDSEKTMIVREFLKKVGKIDEPIANFAELSMFTGVTEETIEKIDRANKPRVSLSEPLTGDGEVTLADALVLENSDAYQLYAWQEMNKFINRSVGELDPRAARIVRGYFGLNPNCGPVTLRQLGEEFGISGERVKQIRDESLRKLRRVFNSGQYYRHLALTVKAAA